MWYYFYQRIFEEFKVVYEMKVFDVNNEKWYHKGKLIEESYKVFLNEHPKKEAMNLAKQYVKENTLVTLKEVNQWREENS